MQFLIQQSSMKIQQAWYQKFNSQLFFLFFKNFYRVDYKLKKSAEYTIKSLYKGMNHEVGDSYKHYPQ